MDRPLTDRPWHYVYGAVWTTPNGPEDGGACIATRASASPLAPWEKDRALRLAAAAPELRAKLRELLAQTPNLRTLAGARAWDDASALLRELDRNLG